MADMSASAKRGALVAELLAKLKSQKSRVKHGGNLASPEGAVTWIDGAGQLELAGDAIKYRWVRGSWQPDCTAHSGIL